MILYRMNSLETSNWIARPAVVVMTGKILFEKADDLLSMQALTLGIERVVAKDVAPAMLPITNDDLFGLQVFNDNYNSGGGTCWYYVPDGLNDPRSLKNRQCCTS